MIVMDDNELRERLRLKAKKLHEDYLAGGKDAIPGCRSCEDKKRAAEAAHDDH